MRELNFDEGGRPFQLSVRGIETAADADGYRDVCEAREGKSCF